jgi:hypothetical protein
LPSRAGLQLASGWDAYYIGLTFYALSTSPFSCLFFRSRYMSNSGGSTHPLKIAVPGKGFLDVTLGARVVPLKGSGKLNLHRQQMERNLGDVIERALNSGRPGGI